VPATKFLATIEAGARTETVLRTEPVVLALAATHQGRIILPAGTTTEAVSSAGIPGLVTRRPTPGAEAPEATPAATHHRRRTNLPATVAAKSAPVKVAGARTETVLRTEPAVLTPAAAHHGPTIFPAGTTAEPASSESSLGIVPRVPPLGAEAPEAAPGAAHHGWRPILSTAAFVKSLSAVVSGARLRIALWAEPAILARTAPHHGLTLSRVRGTIELAAAIPASGIILKLALLGVESPETAPAATHHGRKPALPALSALSPANSWAAVVATVVLSLALGMVAAPKGFLPPFHQPLHHRIRGSIFLGQTVLGAEVQAAEEQPRRPRPTQHHRSEFSFHIVAV